MNYRQFGRLGWRISEIGHGMWGMGGQWGGTDDKQAIEALHKSVELGVNFFDTAWIYGQGHSEQLLGQLIRDYPNRKLYFATKIPPKNLEYPAKSTSKLKNLFPPDHIFEYTQKSLKNLGVKSLDLTLLHVWNDNWADDPNWQTAARDLKKQGLVQAFGVSANRFQPENAIKAIKSGLIDAVEVVYNIFEQAPEDKLFPLCKELEVAIIARVPFDEGALTGNLTLDTKYPETDWRSTYFKPEVLKASVEHAEKLKQELPAGMTMPELALRFILSNPDVSTVIPGMRQVKNVQANIAAGDKGGLSSDLLAKLRTHRWDRRST